MKKMILLLILAAQASHAVYGLAPGSLNFVCKSKATKNRPALQARLKQLNNKKIVEMDKVPFELEVKALGAVYAHQKPQVYRGFLQTEDVWLGFQSLDKKVSFTMYMDELEETHIKFANGNSVQMICEEHRW